MAWPPYPKGLIVQTDQRATVAKLLRLMTCVVRWRELSASFLVAFPGAWLAWLSLSVDGGGKAELMQRNRQGYRSNPTVHEKHQVSQLKVYWIELSLCHAPHHREIYCWPYK
ncbi:DNA-directed RNA polymerase I subunit RPA43 [Fusarium oxysporum f. sp. albedinis]|nr:DNA-directed RNA polymerase I subunit RPA43 [Fusarium oxysporum f. sp. albedinis]